MDTAVLVQSRDPKDPGHLARHMTDLVHRVLQGGFPGGPKGCDWTPAADICEMPDHYLVIVEVAGMSKDEIEVTTDRGELAIAGVRRDPTPCGKVRRHQREIEEGRYRRRLRLPADADTENISARYREGLLHINIPKR
jgi:HSP20 family protein